MKDIIKDEVKSQLPQILLKEVSDYATPMIQSFIIESLENIVLAKSSSQPKSTYEAAASLTEVELKKILLDKIQKFKSYRGAQEHKDLYDALVKYYKLENDLFEFYGKVYSLKRDREDKDKDEDPTAGSDQGLKKRKTSKDVEPSRGSKSKESKSSSSKGSKSQPKSSGKYAQAEEPVFEATDTEMPLNQIDYLGNTDDQPNVKAASRDDWFKYLEEIEVRREDQQLYKFREGDFPRLNMRDIEDMLLLLVHKKLSNLERDVIYELNVELQMFTRRVVILNRVEDLQLGVESYQKKLNNTKPKTFRNMLMRSDEFYKFYNGTLTFVRRVLHDIASNLEMDYLLKRRWSKLDRKRSRIMIKAIDQQLFERRLMRNLEKFITGREYGEDFRLLERTI
ncbi:hypothetical protein Tco_1314796 [Tanacetum coccineum]